MVANVQIQVRNVHVRLEVCDGIPHGGSPDSALPCLAVGVCVRSLVLTTTNEDGDDAFVDGTAAVCPVLLLWVGMLGGMNRVLRNGVHYPCHVLPNLCLVSQIDHKRLKLKELAVYCLPDSRSLAPVTPATTVGADGRQLPRVLHP